jgi:hypothetical protein
MTRWVSDDLGPAKVVSVYEPVLGLDAVLVVDNVARSPSIGGLRVAPDVSTEECVRLARAMTLKNAAAGLPHGGGKSVLRGDPRMSAEQLFSDTTIPIAEVKKDDFVVVETKPEVHPMFSEAPREA